MSLDAFDAVFQRAQLAQRAQRIVAMEDGHIVADYRVAEVEEDVVAVAASSTDVTDKELYGG